MMSSNKTTPTAPLHLRRCQSSGQDQSVFEFTSTVASFDGSNQKLDLSMHLPANQFYNRFNLLAMPESAVTPFASQNPAREFHVPPYNRRPHNSRGTKAAKRRRDARRNRRKWATQMIDEQLSRHIESLWCQAIVMPQQPPMLPTPTPVLPTTTFASVSPAYLPPTPPQLPSFEFQPWSLDVFPPLPTPRRTPTPPLQLIQAPVPKWCPDLPFLSRNAASYPTYPIFFDLSCLPEPKGKPSSGPPSICRELHLWQDGVISKSTKRSRFFPSSPTPRPVVKLPPPACQLCDVDPGMEKASSPLTEYGQLKITETVSRAVKAAKQRALQWCEDEIARGDKTAGDTVANTWKILDTQSAGHSQHQTASNFCVCGPTGSDPHFDTFVTDEQATQACDSFIAELDSKEVPYVHANSLIGCSHEILTAPFVYEHLPMNESGACLPPPLPEPPVSLNEFIVDYDTATPLVGSMLMEELPLPGATSDLGGGLAKDYSLDDTFADSVLAANEEFLDTTHETLLDNDRYVLLDILPINCVDEDGGGRGIRESDAQYTSEQELFKPHALPEQAEAQSLVDTTEFLKLGHAPKCWCGVCEDQPELVAPEKMSEEEGWLVYSTTNEASMATQHLTEIGDDEKTATRTRCSTASEWDVFFPSRTALAREASPSTCGDEGIGLGCGYDFVDDYEW